MGQGLTWLKSLIVGQGIPWDIIAAVAAILAAIFAATGPVFRRAEVKAEAETSIFCSKEKGLFFVTNIRLKSFSGIATAVKGIELLLAGERLGLHQWTGVLQLTREGSPMQYFVRPDLCVVPGRRIEGHFDGGFTAVFFYPQEIPGDLLEGLLRLRLRRCLVLELPVQFQKWELTGQRPLLRFSV